MVPEMIDTEQLQILAQLIDNIEVVITKVEKAYGDKNSEEFNKSKKEILGLQQEIAKIVQ
jgi:methylphosphotriester-DNA--protein-cysteine methyltransferase